MRISDGSSDVCSSDLGRQVEYRRVEFDPGDVELRAAAAHSGPRHRDIYMPGAQQRRGRTRFACDHVVDDQHRRAAQAVFAAAGGGDFKAEGVAERIEYEAGYALWLQKRVQGEGEQRQGGGRG